MDTLRTTVISACTGALALSLAEGVLPLERFQKQIRLLTAILMMTLILRPLLHLPEAALPVPDIRGDLQTADITERLHEMQESAISDSICDALNNAFREKCIPCKVTGCDLHIDETGSIIINEVTVTGNLLTGRVYLREWLGEDISVREEGVHSE